MVQRAWNFLQAAPYNPDNGTLTPFGIGPAEDTDGDTAYHTLDALIVQYVDYVLTTAGPNRSNLTGSLNTGTITGSDGVGSFTFSVVGNYTIREGTSSSGTFSANDTASFSYTLHESGSPPDGSSFTLDDKGNASFTSIGSGSTTTHTLTGILSGNDYYTLREGDQESVSSGSGSTSVSMGESDTASHAGSDSFSYSELRSEVYSSNTFTGGNERLSVSVSGVDSPSESESESNTYGGGSIGSSGSSTDTEQGTDSHTLKLNGSDTLGASWYFTGGNRTLTWDESDSLLNTSSDSDGDTITITSAPGYFENSSGADHGNGGSSVSVHQLETLGFTATGGNNYAWNQSITETDGTTGTISDSITGSDYSTDSETFGQSGESDSSTTSTTDTDTDVDMIYQSLGESGVQTYTLGQFTGGNETYATSQTDADTDTVVSSESTKGGESSSESVSQGSETTSEATSDSTSVSGTDTSRLTDIPILTTSGSKTYAYGGAILSGNTTVTTTEANTHDTDTLVETDIDTSSDTERDTNVFGGDSTSSTVTDTGTVTDEETDTDIATSGESGSTTSSFGLAGGVTSGVADGGSAETDTDSEFGGVTGTDIARETDTEQDLVGASSMTGSLSDATTDVMSDGVLGEDTSNSLGQGGSQIDTETLIESSHAGLGKDAIISAGTDYSTDTDNGTDWPGDTDTIYDNSGESESATDVEGGDTTTESMTDKVSATDSQTVTGTDYFGDGDTVTGSLGAAGMATFGTENTSSTETDNETDTSRESGTDTSNEVDYERDVVGASSITSTLSDGSTDTLNDPETDYDRPTITESGNDSQGVAGLISSGLDTSTDIDNGTDKPTDLDTIIDTSGESESATDVDGGDTTTESMSDMATVTDSMSDTGVDPYSGSDTMTGYLGAGGVVTEGLDNSNGSETDTDTDRSTETGTDTTNELDTEEDLTKSNTLTETLSDRSTDILNDGDTNSDTPTLIESAAMYLGIDEVVYSGGQFSTDIDNGTDQPSGTDTLIDNSGESESETQVAGEDTVSESSSVSDAGTETVVNTGNDPYSSSETVTEYLGQGALLTSGTTTFNSGETGTDTSTPQPGGTDVEVDTSGGNEHDEEAGALANDKQSDQTTVTHTIVSGSSTDYPTDIVNGNESLGSGGTIVGSSETETFDDFSTENETDSDTGSESFSYSMSESVTAGTNESDTSEIQMVSDSFNDTDKSSDWDSVYEFSKETLGASGSIVGGSESDTVTEDGGDTNNGHTTGTETDTDGWHMAFAVGTSMVAESDQDTATTPYTVVNSADDPTATTTTETETIGSGGTILGGNESFDTSESTGESDTETSTESDTSTIKYADSGTNYTDVATATTTILDQPSDDTTLMGSGTVTLITSGTISGGSQTLTLIATNGDEYNDLGGSSVENDTDTAGDDISGTWTPDDSGGSTASLSEVESDTWTTGGTIDEGSMSYTLTYGGSDSDSPVEEGTETIAGQAGDPAQAVGFTLDEPTSDSYSSSETGNVTLGVMGVITSGSDHYTWDEYRSSGVNRNVPGASASINEVGTDTYSLHETGTEFEGDGGSIESGNDNFTWSQAGDNDYQLEQSGIATSALGSSGSLSYTLSENDSVTSTWNDIGYDTLGASDSILGGTDDYSRHQTRNYSYSLGYSYTRLDPYGNPRSDTYWYNGNGVHAISLDDVGTDSLNNDGISDYGSDCYTLIESFQDTATISENFTSYAPGSNINAIASDSFSLVDIGGSSQSGSTTLASHNYTITDNYGEDFNVGIVFLGDTGYFSANDDSDSAIDNDSFSYEINATGSDSYSDGTSVTGWLTYDSTSIQSDSYSEMGTGNYILVNSDIYNCSISQRQAETNYGTGSYNYSGDYESQNTYDSGSVWASYLYGGTYEPGGTGGYQSYSTLGNNYEETSFSEWGDTVDGTSYSSGSSAGGGASGTGTNPDGIVGTWIEKASYFGGFAVFSTYQGYESNFFSTLQQRINNAYGGNLEGPGGGPLNNVRVDFSGSGLMNGELADPSGTMIIPSNVPVYRRGMTTGGDSGDGSDGTYSVFADSNGNLNVAVQTGGGTQDGLPSEEASNLSDFLNGTDRVETASSSAPTTRANQSVMKPDQTELRWGVNGSNGGGGGGGGGDSGSGGGGPLVASGSLFGATAGGIAAPMNAPGSVFPSNSSSTSNSSSNLSSSSPSSGSLNPDPSGLIAMSGPGGDVNGYASNVSDSLAMVDAAPQGDAIATAGTANDTSVVEDPNGNITSETNPLGETTSFSYNASGERTAVTDALGNVTSIAYDSSGDVVSVTDPDGNTTSYDYNAAGQLIKMTDPLGYSATYAYNAAGLLSSTTDRDGRRRDFFYNAAGQITAENWYDANGNLVDELRFGYDSAGRLISASSDEGAYTFTYDSQGRLIHETEPFGLWLSFSYDAAGDRTGEQDSFGGSIVSTYDANGNLLSRQLSAPGQTTIGVTLDYTADGEVNTLTRSAGGSTVGSTVYSYDNSGNVTGIAHLDASGNVLDGFLYAYDAAGQVDSESDYGVAENAVGPVAGVSSPSVWDASILAAMESGNAAGSMSSSSASTSSAGGSLASPSLSTLPGMTSPTNYTYDANGQLTGGGTQTYQYDANGNRINAGDVIGPDNQLLSDGTWNYTYDADGNEIGKVAIATGVSWTYGYDDANQMTSATEYAAGGKTILAQVTYTYDVFGNRLQQTTYTAATGTTTVQRYGYDGQNVWADLNSSNQLETRYLYGDAVDQILARVSATGLVAWYLTDDLGSVRDLMNNAGGIIDHRDYDSFGNIVSETNPAAGDRYGFTGREFDSVTGLQYNRARYYDPSIGRWTSQDPMGFNAGDTNVYRYVGNSPVVLTDPSGMIDFWDGVTIGLQIGGGLLEAGSGVAIAVATAPTGVGIVGGGVLAAHGTDTLFAGIRGIYYGKPQRTYTAQGATAVASMAPISPQAARLTGDIFDAAIPIATGNFTKIPPLTFPALASTTAGTRVVVSATQIPASTVRPLVIASSAPGVLNAEISALQLNMSVSGPPITNKFPDEPLDPQGKKFGETVSVDGRVSIPGRQTPRNVDFVITQEGKLVLGQKHTTLANNEDVLAVGQLKLSGQGSIRKIDNLSGHYQPTVEEGLRFPSLLESLGFETSNARLQLYEFVRDEEGFVTSVQLKINKKAR